MLAWTPSIGFTTNFSLIDKAFAGAIGNSTLSGFVIDENLKIPVSGATVQIVILGIQVTTDVLGFYRIDNLDHGSYSLLVTAADYLDQTTPAVVINTPWTKFDVELVGDGPVEKLTGIEGFVSDRNTALPLEGATVDIVGPSGNLQQTTNEDGYYLFEKLQPGNYDVTAMFNGYDEFTKTILVVTGTPVSFTTNKVDFYLKSKPTRVFGQVQGFLGGTDPQGLANVPVKAILIYGDIEDDISEIYKETTTDASGNYELTDLPFGNFLITAIPIAYETQIVQHILTPELVGMGLDLEQDFIFDDIATLEVTVKSTAYHADMVLPGVEISLRSIEGLFDFSNGLQLKQTTDANGVATFSNLPTTTLLEVSVPEFQLDQATFYPAKETKTEVFADPSNPTYTEKLDLKPRPNALLGTVSEKTGYLDSGILSIPSSPRMAFPIIKDTDSSDGAILVETVEPTNPQFSFYPYCSTIDGFGFNFVPIGKNPLDCWEQGAIAITDLEGATIVIKEFEFNGMSITPPNPDPLVTSDDKGEYIFENLLPGKYTLEVKKPNLLKREIIIDLNSFTIPQFAFQRGLGQVENLLLFPPTVDIFGFVFGELFFDTVSEKRVPLNGATINLQNDLDSFPGESNESGFYVIKNVPLNIPSALLATGDATIDNAGMIKYDLTISADGYAPFSEKDTTVPNELSGIIYSKNLLQIQNPEKLTITEQRLSLDLDDQVIITGLGFSNLLLTTIYDLENGFSSAKRVEKGDFASVEMNGGLFLGIPATPENIWEQPTQGTYEIFYHPGMADRYEFEVVGRPGSIFPTTDTARDVPLYRFKIDGSNPIANLFTGNICTAAVCPEGRIYGVTSSSGATLLHTLQTGGADLFVVNPEPIDHTVDYNLLGYAFDSISGKPVPGAEVTIEMRSDGRTGGDLYGLIIEPFRNPQNQPPPNNFKYGQVPRFGDGTGFTMTDTSDAQGKFKLEGTLQGNDQLGKAQRGDACCPTPPFRILDVNPVDMIWKMMVTVANTPGYEDIEGSFVDFPFNAPINNFLSSGPSSGIDPPMLPDCGTFSGPQPRRGCSTDFPERIKIFLDPHGLIRTPVFSNNDESLTLDGGPFVGQSPPTDPDNPEPQRVEVTMKKLPGKFFDLDFSVPPPFPWLLEPLENGQYTVDITAKNHYSITTPPIDISDNPIDLIHRTLEVRMEPIPLPKVLSVVEPFSEIDTSQFFVYYENGIDDMPDLPENRDRELKGFFPMGFTSPFTDSGRWQVLIDRQVLRTGFIDPVLFVELTVKPKPGGVCKQDQKDIVDEKITLEDLTKVFPGEFLPLTQLRDLVSGNPIMDHSVPPKHADSNKTMISAWGGEMDPEHDLPCGNLDFIFLAHTAKTTAEEESIDYKLWPSYLTPFVNLIMTMGAFVDDNTPAFIKKDPVLIKILNVPIKPSDVIKYGFKPALKKLFGGQLPEISIGDLKVAPRVTSETTRFNEILDYTVSKFSIKSSLGIIKPIDNLLAKVFGMVNLGVPDVFVELGDTVFKTDNGIFQNHGQIDVDIDVKDIEKKGKEVSAEQIKEKKEVEKKTKQKVKKKFGSSVKKLPGGRDLLKVKSNVTINYDLESLNAKGVDNPRYPIGTSLSSITETGKLGGKINVEYVIPLASKTIGRINPVVFAVVNIIEQYTQVMDVRIVADYKPGIEASWKLSKFDPSASPVRTVTTPPPPTIVNSHNYDAEIFYEVGSTVSSSIGVKGTFDLIFKNIILGDGEEAREALEITKATLTCTFKATAEVFILISKFQVFKGTSDPYICWERIWESESIAYLAKLEAVPPDFSGAGFPADNIPGPISTTPPPSMGPVQLGILREKMHPSASLSLDSNDNGNSLLGYVQQDLTRTLPNNLQGEYMVLDETGVNLVWTEPGEIHEEKNMPTMAAEVSYFENDKAIAVWSSIQDNITYPFGIIQHHNKADVEFSVYDAPTDTWSAFAKLTDDSFIDTTPVIATDEVTGKVIAVWIKDKDGHFLTRDDNDLYYSIWDGASWSTPAVIIGGAKALDAAVAYDNDKAVLVYTHEISQNDNGLSKIEFEQNSWGSSQQVASGQVANPAVVFKTANGIVIWSETGIEDLFPTINYAEFSNPLGSTKELTKTDRILEIEAVSFGDSTIVVWSVDKGTSTSLLYSQFDGTDWTSYTAVDKDGMTFPVLGATTDTSSQRLHIAYYEFIPQKYDLAFYRTSLTGTEAPEYVPPEEPLSDEPFCLLPTSGDWVIDSSCTLENSASAPANVVVQSGIVLTIPNGLSLTLPSSNSLTVESGGRVSVVFGGNILFT